MGIIMKGVPLGSGQFRSDMTLTERTTLTETIRCRGHRNVLSLHPGTFMITKDLHLTCKGDCIIAIGADKGAADLSPAFRKALSTDDAILFTKLTCRGISVTALSCGSAGMTLLHPTDLVWRKSTYVCGRTVGIGSDLAAKDLPRELVDYLMNGEELLVEMTVSTGGYEGHDQATAALNPFPAS